MVEAQVFVKIDNYKDVLHTVGLIKEKVNEAKNTLMKLKELKNQEKNSLHLMISNKSKAILLILKAL